MGLFNRATKRAAAAKEAEVSAAFMKATAPMADALTPPMLTVQGGGKGKAFKDAVAEVVGLDTSSPAGLVVTGGAGVLGGVVGAMHAKSTGGNPALEGILWGTTAMPIGAAGMWAFKHFR
jgi:hypothetical protein